MDLGAFHLLTFFKKANIPEASEGTPKSGHVVKWNCFTTFSTPWPEKWSGNKLFKKIFKFSPLTSYLTFFDVSDEKKPANFKALYNILLSLTRGIPKLIFITIPPSIMRKRSKSVPEYGHEPPLLSPYYFSIFETLLCFEAQEKYDDTRFSINTRKQTNYALTCPCDVECSYDMVREFVDVCHCDVKVSRREGASLRPILVTFLTPSFRESCQLKSRMNNSWRGRQVSQTRPQIH